MRYTYGLILVCCYALTLGCTTSVSLLEQVKARGELIIATRNSATAYYEGVDGPAGFEYDLAQQFAHYLGVKLHLIIPNNLDQLWVLVDNRKADLAAAGLTVTQQRAKKYMFGPIYQKITPYVVYRSGNKKPKKIDDIVGKQIEVLSNSSHVEALQALQNDHPALRWQESQDMESEDLLYLVWKGVIDYTVADSNELAVSQYLYPELRAAFPLRQPQALAWAFRRSRDTSLVDAAKAFFKQYQASGQLAQLLERHYGHIGEFDYVETRKFLTHQKQRLPKVIDHFVAAGKQYALDWRLLAAMGYQESHWNPKAVSPTGVRGIMMLTRNTAKSLGIKDRTDPKSSIFGGAAYFKRMKNKIPQRIVEPDRTWMALAAYNVGYGHLEDARVITQQRGKNPDRWIDVKESLPLLSKRKWYKKVKYGYARGREPVQYVESVRTYFDMLVRSTEPRVREANQATLPIIDSPAL